MSPPSHPATFSSEELQSLTRVWISVASDHQPPVTSDDLFWGHVAAEYAANASPTCYPRTAKELQRQWKLMCPSMVAIVTLFNRKCQHSSSGVTGEADAFEWAIKTFRRTTKRSFEFAGTLWLLISQKTWWKVLKPHLMRQFSLMHDEEEGELDREQQQQELETEPESSVLSVSVEDPQEFPLSPVCGVARVRSEEEDEEELERRVRQRLVFEDLPSSTSVEEVPPKMESQTPMLLTSSLSGSNQPGSEGAEEKTVAMAQVMEQRLELDIMTQSEDGLSAEAKEFLCLRRREILMKLREKFSQEFSSSSTSITQTYNFQAAGIIILARIFKFSFRKATTMSKLTTEEADKYGGKHPSEWHDKEHGNNDLCTKMMLAYSRWGRWHSTKWLLTNCKEPPTAEVIDDVHDKSLQSIIWFYENRFEGCSSSTITVAARKGRLDVVKWFYQNRNGGLTTAAMDAAATHGHLDVVTWLHENDDKGCTAAAMDGAAAHGHLDVVIWLHENRKEGCTTAAMDGAASNGHLDVVKWLHENRSEGCTSAAMDGAVSNSRVNVAIWLMGNREEGCTTAAMDNVAGQGYLDAIKWLNENRNEGCSSAAMVNAASKGYLDVVKYLHTNVGLQGTDDAITAAAENGHLPVVRYLVAILSEPRVADAVARAEKNGHVEVVTFLKKHNGSMPLKRTKRAIPPGAEAGTVEMTRVMERRLELDIMTQSEDGLSAEAKEYLRLRRQEILTKLG